MSIKRALSKALENSQTIWDERRSSINAPNSSKQARTFGVKEVAEIIGVKEWDIRNLDRRGAIKAPDRDHKGNRAYTLEKMNEIREALGLQVGRLDEDPVCILGSIAYKGGVGKTTNAVSLAQYLTMRGKKVLLVDCDPQASCTSHFDYIPDSEIDLEDTIYRVLVRDERHGQESYLDPSDIKNIIKDTHWGDLKLIPSSLELYSAEYLLPAELYKSHNNTNIGTLTRRLLNAIETIEDDFDVIILDAPPSIGLISMAIVHASDALICPMQPSQIDFASAQTFLSMILEFLDRFEDKELSFLRILINNYVSHAGTDNIVNMLYDAYGSLCMRNILARTQEINNAASQMMTLYELPKPIGDRKTYNRGRTMLDAVHSETESLIELTWPSRH